MDLERLRRNGRISLDLPIILAGTGAVGSVFVLYGKTILANRQGAKILLARQLGPLREIGVRCVCTWRETDARVVGQIGQEADGYYYGVAFLDAKIDVWKIKFPPISEGAEAIGRVVLECGGRGILSGQAAAECH